MTWLQRHRLREFVVGSLWFTPLLGMVAGAAFAPTLRLLDEHTHWRLLHYGVEGARGIAGAIAASMFTLTVLVFSIILVAVQLSSSQLSPRVIASSVLRDRAARYTLGLFVFTYVLSVGVLGRIEASVPELPLLVAMVFSVLSIGAFLYLIDYVAKALRPVSVCGRIATKGFDVFEDIYRHPAPETGAAEAPPTDLPGRESGSTVPHVGEAGVLLAFDVDGLAAAAQRTDGLIALIPQVGDFVATGDPLFRLFDGAAEIAEEELRQAVAFGPERTLTQDPAFALRILVDIANKALSPGINDPTTAVQAIDYIHRFLRRVGAMRLDNGAVRDRDGRLRLWFRTPDWQDFVALGVSEIRIYGAGSLQVARRLRAMLQNLIQALPAHRHPPLSDELDLLRRSVERNFPDPEDWVCAGEPDSQGLGGAAAEGHAAGRTPALQLAT
jgi:uncharacterized membrane protein